MTATLVMQVWQGTLVRLSNHITQSDGVTPVTTATVTVTVTYGDGTVSAPLTPTNDGGGDYHVDVATTIAGGLIHDWVCTAPVTVASEGRLYVIGRAA